MQGSSSSESGSEFNMKLLLKQRKVHPSSNYKQIGEKEGGVVAGFIGSRTNKKCNTINYIIKKFKYTSNQTVRWNNEFYTTGQCIREFFAGSFFEYLLGNNTAPIRAVLFNEANIYGIASKMIPDVLTMHTFTRIISSNKNMHKHTIDALNSKLKFLVDFEKIVAACSFLGDADYNASNLLIKENSKAQKKFLKLSKLIMA